MATIEVGRATDPGRRRGNNEDSFLVLLPPGAPQDAGTVLAVADGMGGHQAGEVASRIAVDVLEEALGGGAQASPLDAALKEPVERANAEVLAQAGDGRRGMGTTLTAAVIRGSRLALAHVGDSRAYLLRGERLQQLTRDHSWVAEEVRAGRISPEEAATHPRRNLLMRALGIDGSVSVDTSEAELHPGDQVLLCSDGLHGVVGEGEIATILMEAQSAQQAAEALVRRANAAGGPDNITVLVARLGAVSTPDARRSTPWEATTQTMLAGRKARSGRRSKPVAGVVAQIRQAVRPGRRSKPALGRGRRLLAIVAIVLAALAIALALTLPFGRLEPLLSPAGAQQRGETAEEEATHAHAAVAVRTPAGSHKQAGLEGPPSGPWEESSWYS